MSSVVVTSTVQLASAPADVWPLVSDTDRINRLLFGRGVVYEPIDGGADTGARFLAHTRTAGFAMSYEEAPYEWTTNKSFSVFRKMRSGPLHSYRYAVRLDPGADGGTRLTIHIELAPRHWSLAPIARFQAQKVASRVAKIAEAIDAHVRDNVKSPFAVPAALVNVQRLERANHELARRGVGREVASAIVELLREGSDADLLHIRPFELAHARGLDERETLRGFLHAVLLGVAELRWSLVCPSCRTGSDEVASLAEIGEASHCHFCDLSYGIELDRAVEATFLPHPSVREVKSVLFCAGGPARTPHVLSQVVASQGSACELEAPALPGRYRLFARGGATASIEVAPTAPATAQVRLADESLSPPELCVAPGAAITVTNAMREPRHVKIELLEYASRAATAHVLTTMSEFRRHFSKDLLKPGMPLKVASCAIFFSDLTGSTALYTKAGDAAAFRLVDDHFDVLRKVIDEYGGAIVKTMGDAVMASFIEPIASVRAAIACLEAFERFRRAVDYGELTGIKIGLYSGPCYVVTANESIDYFGQTVNCASRVQHCAESGEILFEEDLWAELPKADAERLRLVEVLETRVKGVELPLRLARTTLASAASRPAAS